MGTALMSRMAVMTHLPPNLSVRIPTGKRKTAPTSTGTPSSHPTSMELHLKTPLLTKKVTSTPLIIHTAKQTVKASVVINNIRCDLPGLLAAIGNWIQRQITC